MKYLSSHWSSIKRLVVALIFLAINACTYDNIQIQNFKSKGIITGPDFRMCICCGGWEIVIENKTYHFSQLPANSGINLDKEKFPLRVKLDWDIDNSACHWIVVGKIAIDQ